MVEVAAMVSEKSLTYSMRELPEVLGVSRTTAYRLAKSKGFPIVKISPKRLVVPKAALERWLDQQAGGAYD
jgi:excisionase family DNA binding protein